MKAYLIGSLRNPVVPELGGKLRKLGFDIFEDWVAAGPEADDYWQKYEMGRGHTMAQALKGFAAQHVYEFDKRHLDLSDFGVLVMPAGKSGHLELGYLKGQGKPIFIVFDKEPERWDVMYAFATGIYMSHEEFLHDMRTVAKNDKAIQEFYNYVEPTEE